MASYSLLHDAFRQNSEKLAIKSMVNLKVNMDKTRKKLLPEIKYSYT